MSSQLNLQDKYNMQMHWLNSALGQYLQAAEQVLYDQEIVDLFGFNALQMGFVQMDLLRNSRIAHRYQSSEYSISAERHDICCDDDFLPFEDASLDLLLLPHRLEFSERPHQTLREAARVMMPDGHLLISGFNPLSTWGATSALKNLFSNQNTLPRTFPWNGKFIGLARLKDWLALLGFEVLSVQMCCHVPPFEQEAWHKRFGFMEKLGADWLPMMGGVYFIVAKKRVAGMTLLKPNWKKAPLKSTLIVRPTQRKPSQKEHIEQ